MKPSPLAALLLSCVPAIVAAQNDPHAGRAAPVAVAVRVGEPIHVDGRLDEAAWAAATPVTEFTQYDPDEGKPASEATEARIVYDDEALYVGVRLHDRGHVNTRLGRRDMDLSDADWFGVQIDSYHDHLTGFGFDVNPSGVRRDEAKTDRGDDNSWDAVWEAATTVDSGGWTAEFRIPFSQLRFNPRTDTWGILLERIIGRRSEYATSSFTPKSERGGIARWGHLTGLRGVRASRRLELLPYTVARAEYVDPRGNPFRGDHEYGTRIGADVKYRVTSNLTLDATVNPDFGQVELDPAVVNLTQFETVFEERRPFFVEGREIFNFNAGNFGTIPAGGSLFYSRRVGGLTYGARPGTPTADVPQETHILGAAKLSGQPGRGWSIGVMDALTGRERARFIDESGEQSMVAEPLTNFFVGRLKRDLRGGRSYVGGMITAVNRDLETPELRGALRAAGYTAGVDFKHEFANRAWRVTGFGSLSHVRGDSLAILAEQLVVPYHQFARPDSRALSVDSGATSLSGFQGEVRVAKQAGAHWRTSAGVATITPGYEIGDLGSQRRAARMDVDGSVTYLRQRPGPVLRYWQASLGGRREWNYDGDPILLNFNSNGYLQHLSYWSANYSLTLQPRSLDDRLTRGGPVALRPMAGSAYLSVGSDPRKPLVGSASVFAQSIEKGGGGDVNGYVEVQVKTSPRWNLTVGPSFDRARSAAQALGSVADTTPAALFGQRYLFTDLRQTTVSMDVRLNYTFNPDLTLQVYVAPFVSSVDFGDTTRYLVRARTFDFAPDELSGVHPTDFTVRSLRGNAVLRWEWRPGSTVYLAWQQQREDFEEGIGTFRFGRDRAALFDTRPDNVFLIKVNYWLNP
ncbi:MAG TPA: DUF5916 domain-containing protein [Longimicrobium sp.]|nr:DUF5916 domain-containing protein [Longimicrobium sp.]